MRRHRIRITQTSRRTTCNNWPLSTSASASAASLCHLLHSASGQNLMPSERGGKIVRHSEPRATASFFTIYSRRLHQLHLRRQIRTQHRRMRVETSKTAASLVRDLDPCSKNRDRHRLLWNAGCPATDRWRMFVVTAGSRINGADSRKSRSPSSRFGERAWMYVLAVGCS